MEPITSNTLDINNIEKKVLEEIKERSESIFRFTTSESKPFEDGYTYLNEIQELINKTNSLTCYMEQTFNGFNVCQEPKDFCTNNGYQTKLIIRPKEFYPHVQQLADLIIQGKIEYTESYMGITIGIREYKSEKFAQIPMNLLTQSLVSTDYPSIKIFNYKDVSIFVMPEFFESDIKTAHEIAIEQMQYRKV